MRAPDLVGVVGDDHEVPIARQLVQIVPGAVKHHGVPRPQLDRAHVVAQRLVTTVDRKRADPITPPQPDVTDGLTDQVRVWWYHHLGDPGPGGVQHIHKGIEVRANVQLVGALEVTDLRLGAEKGAHRTHPDQFITRWLDDDDIVAAHTDDVRHTHLCLCFAYGHAHQWSNPEGTSASNTSPLMP